MRRDFKLIRQILHYVEQEKQNGDEIPLPELADYRTCEIEYHVKLCEEAGYLDIRVSSHDKKPVAIVRMSWQGHEALDELRKDSKSYV